MKQAAFQAWLSRADDLTGEQQREAIEVLSGRADRAASTAAVELAVGEDRQCPHCKAKGAVSRGTANGLKRYRCKGCGRTFNAVTGTPLQGLHHRDKWLAYGKSLSNGETLKDAAERCGVDVTTAFRWRHRFLKAAEVAPEKLKGIVEADETYFLESRKGDRNIRDRKPRKRGGKASKRGISKEQTPVLMATARGGRTFGKVLNRPTVAEFTDAMGTTLAPDALLVTDGNPTWRSLAEALGVDHEALTRRAGEITRGSLHIQTVNNRHGEFKGFIKRFRGVSTKYLPSYVDWYLMRESGSAASPRTCLAAATSRRCLGFTN